MHSTLLNLTEERERGLLRALTQKPSKKKAYLKVFFLSVYPHKHIHPAHTSSKKSLMFLRDSMLLR
jgi:hypothetical protein